MGDRSADISSITKILAQIGKVKEAMEDGAFAQIQAQAEYESIAESREEREVPGANRRRPTRQKSQLLQQAEEEIEQQKHIAKAKFDQLVKQNAALDVYRRALILKALLLLAGFEKSELMRQTAAEPRSAKVEQTLEGLQDAGLTDIDVHALVVFHDTPSSAFTKITDAITPISADQNIRKELAKITIKSGGLEQLEHAVAAIQAQQRENLEQLSRLAEFYQDLIKLTLTQQINELVALYEEYPDPDPEKRYGLLAAFMSMGLGLESETANWPEFTEIIADSKKIAALLKARELLQGLKARRAEALETSYVKAISKFRKDECIDTAQIGDDTFSVEQPCSYIKQLEFLLCAAPAEHDSLARLRKNALLLESIREQVTKEDEGTTLPTYEVILRYQAKQRSQGIRQPATPFQTIIDRILDEGGYITHEYVQALTQAFLRMHSSAQCDSQRIMLWVQRINRNQLSRRVSRRWGQDKEVLTQDIIVDMLSFFFQQAVRYERTGLDGDERKGECVPHLLETMRAEATLLGLDLEEPIIISEPAEVAEPEVTDPAAQAVFKAVTKQMQKRDSFAATYGMSRETAQEEPGATDASAASAATVAEKQGATGASAASAATVAQRQGATGARATTTTRRRPTRGRGSRVISFFLGRNGGATGARAPSQEPQQQRQVTGFQPRRPQEPRGSERRGSRPAGRFSQRLDGRGGRPGRPGRPGSQR